MISNSWKEASCQFQFQKISYQIFYWPSSPLSSCPESGLIISISLAELALAELVPELPVADALVATSGDVWPSLALAAAVSRSGACKCKCVANTEPCSSSLPCCHSAATARREEQEEQTQEVVEGRICCSGADPSLTGSLRWDFSLVGTLGHW